MNDKRRILIVDDTPSNISILVDVLRAKYEINVTTSGLEALALIESGNKPDLILMDIMMPGMDGHEVCRRLKSDENTKNIPVLFVTSKNQVADEAMGLSMGAVDYITKPFTPEIVRARVDTHVNLHLHKQHLEKLVAERTQQLRAGYLETIQRLTLASESKDEDTGSHIRRVSYYAREIAERMGTGEPFSTNIFHAAPMHDIGKVAIPDSILLKSGMLTDKEFTIIKSHTVAGAKILEGSESPYLKMAAEIAMSHHERWDGTGYPQGLQKEEIPLSARIMNICDQYDALRSKRPYKVAFDHNKAAEIILKGDCRTMPGHFDPEVHLCFERSLSTFNEIFEEHQDESPSAQGPPTLS